VGSWPGRSEAASLSTHRLFTPSNSELSPEMLREGAKKPPASPPGASCIGIFVPNSRFVAGGRNPDPSNVIIQAEFIGMRSKANRIGFTLPFVIDPGVDHVLREHVASEEVLVIGSQCRQYFVERAGRLRDLVALFRLQIV